MKKKEKVPLPEGWRLFEDDCIGWSLEDETGRIVAQHPVNNPARWRMALQQIGGRFGYFIQLRIPEFMIEEYLPTVKRMFIEHARKDVAERVKGLLFKGVGTWTIQPAKDEYCEVLFNTSIFVRGGIDSSMIGGPPAPLS